MRILITGVTGFVGGHLVEFLRGEGGHDLFGFSRRNGWADEWSHLEGLVRLVAGEMSDRVSLESCLLAAKPDWVFHLAGFAHPGRSFREPDACWSDNLSATRSLYHAVARLGLSPRILFISTGLVYGDPTRPDDVFSETTPLRPTSPYAASKAAADLMSYQVSVHPGLDIVRVRPFNQIGPRQSADYAVANFARQVANIERGRQPPVLDTGDLSARRDLTDVRDMVAAYRLLIEKGHRGEVYNAGCGTTYCIGDVLDRLIAQSDVRVEVRTKVDSYRPPEIGVCRADSAKLKAVTGWAPRYSLDQTLRDVLTYWRAVADRPQH